MITMIINADFILLNMKIYRKLQSQSLAIPYLNKRDSVYLASDHVWIEF